jgi:predicted nucleic acid-binding protein
MTETQQFRVYLDAMVFIYAVEGNEATGPSARDLLTCLREHPGAARTSELTLAEVLAPTKKRGGVPPALKSMYLQLLTSSWVELMPVSRQILCRTVEIRPLGMKLPDAIHIATAVENDCKYIVTSDSGMAAPANVTRLQPNESGVGRIREALS